MIVYYRKFICISTVDQGKCHSTLNIHWMLWPRRAMHVVTYSQLYLQWTRLQACIGYLERNEQPLHITLSSLDKSTNRTEYSRHIPWTLFVWCMRKTDPRTISFCRCWLYKQRDVYRPNVMQMTHSLTLVHEHALTINIVIINFYRKRTSLLTVLSLKFMIVTLRKVDEVCASRRLKIMHNCGVLWLSQEMELLL